MKPKQIAGILFGLGGIACFALSVFVFIEGFDQQKSDSEAARRADLSCREQLVRLGRITPEPNNEIELRITDTENEAGIVDPRSALSDLTTALAMCPGREIVSACIGTACEGVPDPITLIARLGLIDKD